MSRDYYTVCMDCGERFSLGKSVEIQDTRLNKGVYGFAFISDGHDDEFERADPSTKRMVHTSWRYLQHFLMRHRGHEIRVLPEALIGPYESVSFPQYAPHDPSGSLDFVPEENYYLSPTGLPTQEQDAKSVPQEVLNRLEELSRGEKLKRPSWDEPDPVTLS